MHELSGRMPTTVQELFEQHQLPVGSVGWDLLVAFAKRSRALADPLHAAIFALRTELGEKWLGGPGSFDTNKPRFILDSWFHNHAAERVVWLAGQLNLCRELPLFRQVCKGLIAGDGGEWLHSLLQIEVAALARLCCFDVEFEPTVPGLEGRPADLRIVTTSGSVIHVETRVLLKSIQARKSQRITDQLFEMQRSIEDKTGLRLFVDASNLDIELDENFVEELSLLILHTANSNCWPLCFGGVSVDLWNGGEAFAIGPTFKEPGWRRLESVIREKSRKYSIGSLPVWFRFDALDGLWQFTPLGSVTLRNKLAMFEEFLLTAIPDVRGVAGVVLSSGLLQTQGTFVAESTDRDSGSFAFRTLIGTFGVRETLVVPFESSEGTAETWHQIYSREPELGCPRT